MSLLIALRQSDWMTDAALRDRLVPLLPGVAIHVEADDWDPEAITMVAGVTLPEDLARRLPNLALFQKLGAGVDGVVAVPGLAPSVRVARLRAPAAAREISEYCLTAVLMEQRNFHAHAADQRAQIWRPLPPRDARATTVAVLGLGHIGAETARVLARHGFPVIGWSRSPKTLPGIDCRAGPAALPGVLAEADHVCAILPSTPLTRGLIRAETIAAMKPGAQLVNAGRGDLVVEPDLLAALDAGHLSRAVLDVFGVEPLPADSPLWSHPRVTVTPHVSGWSLDDNQFAVVAENWHRLQDGRPLLHEVDRAEGY